MGELQSLLKRLDVLGAIPPAQADDAPDAVELRQQLTGGVQHCLYWLFGLELPGFDKQEEWGGDFHVSFEQCGEARMCFFIQSAFVPYPHCLWVGAPTASKLMLFPGLPCRPKAARRLLPGSSPAPRQWRTYGRWWSLSCCRMLST